MLLGQTATQLDLSDQTEAPGLHRSLANICASLTQDATSVSCVCGSRPAFGSYGSHNIPCCNTLEHVAQNEAFQ